PRFLAMLCVIAVFIPSFYMVGVGRALFPPLALAVAFSMIASYLLSSTLVPVLAIWLFRHRRGQAPHRAGAFGRGQERFGKIAARLIGWRWLVLVGYVVVCVPLVFLLSHVGTELFPRVDTGQFQLRIRAPAGTRLEKTEEIVRGVDQAIRQE